jgi:hypothetical protein
LVFALTCGIAHAARYFVLEPLAESGVSESNTIAATASVRTTVLAHGTGDTLVNDRSQADYVLQPRIVRMGNGFVVTIEKMRAGEILFATQSKAPRANDLERAAQRATLVALNEPESSRTFSGATSRATGEAPKIPYENTAQAKTPPDSDIVVIREPAQQAPAQTQPAAQSKAQASGWPLTRKMGYITLGMGPFMPSRLKTSQIMYNAMAGYNWDINPQAAIKILGEGSFSSGAERAHLYNFGAGATWFVNSTTDSSPYATVDFGYAFAQDADNKTAEGASFGAGVGYRFFRLTETTMDVLLRYNVLTATVSEGSPSVLGVRLAVNF